MQKNTNNLASGPKIEPKSPPNISVFNTVITMRISP
jgi:hypothetical protein